MPQIEKWLEQVLHWGMYEIPPGPKFVPLHLCVNIQKVGMPVYLIILIWYFQNFSATMLMYSVMHGTYGMLWYLKHCVYPDKSMEDKCTIVCAIICWVLILGPYMIPAYLLASGIASNNTQTQFRIYGSCTLYIMGVTLALISDA